MNAAALDRAVGRMLARAGCAPVTASTVPPTDHERLWTWAARRAQLEADQAYRASLAQAQRFLAEREAWKAA